MKKAYLGKNTILSRYFTKDTNFIDLDIFNKASWYLVDNIDALFLYIPKKPGVIEQTKKFLLYCFDVGVKHIVKLGSLGPYRLVHKQLDTFAKECGVNVTTLSIAPIMNSIFYEQYDKGTLLNYRGPTSAPYLDPQVLIYTINKVLGDAFYFGYELEITGDEQYFIKDVALILDECGFPVKDIVNIPYSKTHDIDDRDADEILLARLGQKYYEGWFPKVSLTTQNHLKISGRSFADFVHDDRHLLSLKYLDDCYL